MKNASQAFLVSLFLCFSSYAIFSHPLCSMRLLTFPALEHEEKGSRHNRKLYQFLNYIQDYDTLSTKRKKIDFTSLLGNPYLEDTSRELVDGDHTEPDIFFDYLLNCRVSV